MLRMVISAVTAVLCTGLMGAAPSDDRPATAVDRCLYVSQIDTGAFQSSQTGYIRTQRGVVYRLDAPSDCFDPYGRLTGVEPNSGVSDKLCPNDELRVNVVVSGLPRTCIVRLSQPVTNAEELGTAGLGAVRSPDAVN